MDANSQRQKSRLDPDGQAPLHSNNNHPLPNPIAVTNNATPPSTNQAHGGNSDQLQTQTPQGEGNQGSQHFWSGGSDVQHQLFYAQSVVNQQCFNGQQVNKLNIWLQSPPFVYSLYPMMAFNPFRMMYPPPSLPPPSAPLNQIQGQSVPLIHVNPYRQYYAWQQQLAYYQYCQQLYGYPSSLPVFPPLPPPEQCPPPEAKSKPSAASAASTSGNGDSSEAETSSQSPLKDAKISSSTTTPEKEQEEGLKTKPPIVVGRKRGGRVLPTGVVKKRKSEDNDNDNHSKEKPDSQSQYMAEVRRYQDKSCWEETRSKRPLLK